MSFQWNHRTYGNASVPNEYEWVFRDRSMEQRNGRHQPFDRRLRPRFRSDKETRYVYQLWWLIRYTDTGEFDLVHSDPYYPPEMPTRRALATIAGRWIDRKGLRTFHLYEGGHEVPWWNRNYEIWKVGAQGWRSNNPSAR